MKNLISKNKLVSDFAVKDSDCHTHGQRSAVKDSDCHTHGQRSAVKDSDCHTHGQRSVVKDNDCHTHGQRSAVKDSDCHTHGQRSAVKDTKAGNQNPSREVVQTIQWPKEKGQTTIYKTLHRKPKIEQH